LDTTINLNEDFAEPAFVMLDSLVLACNEDSVQLQVFYIDPFTEVLWNGPGNFSSTSPEPFVELAGEYELIVTGANGCLHIDSIDVLNPPEIPSIDYEVDTINCAQAVGAINLIYSGDLSFQWLDESSIMYSGSNLNSLKGGYYFLTITDNIYNCTSETVIYLPADTLTPINQIATPDTLNCINSSMDLYLESLEKVQTVHWTGPGIDVINPTVTINNIGWYFAEITGSNNCVKIDSVLIIEEENFLSEPEEFILDCELDSIQISIEEIPSSSYSWYFEGSLYSNNKQPYISQAGQYQVIVETNSGCIDSTFVQVIADLAPPLFSLSTIGELNCTDTSMVISAIPVSDYTSFEWNGPSWSSNLLSDTIYTEGTYYFNITGINHCIALDSLVIETNQYYPGIEAIGDSVNCHDDSGILRIQAEINGSYSKLFWNGPDFYFSTSEINTVQDTGIYILSVEGDKGCFSYDTTYVIVDTLPPPFLMNPLDTINCFRDSVDLSISTNEEIISLKWTGPQNFIAYGNSSPYKLY